MNDVNTEPSDSGETMPVPHYKVRGTDQKSAKIGRLIHIELMTSAVQSFGLAQRLKHAVNGVDLTQTSVGFTKHVLEGLEPRDPAEEMLIAQLILAYTRSLHLADLAFQQTQPDQIKILNEYADKAANNYRRLYVALLDGRKGNRAGNVYAQIHQANIANQQVVNNQAAEENRTNEQGCQHAHKAPIPVDPNRPGLTQGQCATEQTMGPINRSKDKLRKREIQAECDATRRAERYHDGDTPV